MTGKQPRRDNRHDEASKECPDGPFRWMMWDTYGPVEVQTPNKKRYVLVVLCMLTKYIWSLFMRAKSDVGIIIIQFVRVWENRLNTKISRIFCDGDPTYQTDGLLLFYDQKGIQLVQKTAYGSHWRHGLIDQAIQWLTGSSGAVRVEANMPKCWWGEAWAFCTMVRNVTPDDAGVCPKAKLFQADHYNNDWKKVITFGTETWAFITRENPLREGRHKLVPKARRCTYVGDDEDITGVRLLEVEEGNRLIIEDRLNCVFNEDCFTFKTQMTLDPSSMGYKQDTDEDIVLAVQEQLLKPRPAREWHPSRQALENIVAQQHTINYPVHLFDLSSPYYTPQNQKEARRCASSDQWYQAEKREMQRLYDVNAFRLVPPEFLPHTKVISSTMTYKLKSQHGVLPQDMDHKARFCIRGDMEQITEEEDLHASVTTYAIVRIILSLATQRGWRVRVSDVVQAYLNAEIETAIKIKQPQGHVSKEHPDWCLLVLKNLYGRRTSGTNWDDLFVTIMLEFGFTQTEASGSLFHYEEPDTREQLVVTNWVDDIISTSSCEMLHQKFLDFINQRVELKQLGYIEDAGALGLHVEINHEKGTLKIHADSYSQAILDRYKLANCTPAATPATRTLASPGRTKHFHIPDLRAPAGSLLHHARTCRPDIAYAVGMLCRVAANGNHDEEMSEEGHARVKRICRYLVRHPRRGLIMHRDTNGGRGLEIYVDSNHDINSTYGFVILYNGLPIDWTSRRASHTTLSATESELAAASEALKACIFYRKVLSGIGQRCTEPTVCWEDNQAVVKLMNNTKPSTPLRHIAIRLSWARQQVQDGHVTFKYVATSDNLADIFTKPVDTNTMERLLAPIMG